MALTLAEVADAVAERLWTRIAVGLDTYLAELEDESRLHTRAELADYLGVAVRTVDTLMTEGMPTVRVASSPRFDVERVRVWLDERDKKAKYLMGGANRGESDGHAQPKGSRAGEARRGR